jgi:RNA polymerase sigma-54 factor
MALTQRLELRQSHALVMTPQLMQAIKLLQLSNLELASYVEGELERNPLLEHQGESEPSTRQPLADGATASEGESTQSTWDASDRPSDEIPGSQQATGQVTKYQVRSPIPMNSRPQMARPPARVRMVKRYRAIRNGRVLATADGMEVIIILKRTSRRRRRWPSIWPSN